VSPLAPAVAIVTCSPIDFGCIAQEASQSAFASIVKAMGEAVVAMIGFLSSFWLTVPSPTVATGGGSAWQLSDLLGQLQRWTAPVTLVIAVISFSIALGRMAFTGNAGEGRLIVRQVAAVGAGTTAVAAVTQLLISFGDAFSPWVIQQASGGREPSEGLKGLIGLGFASGDPKDQLGLWFFLFALAALGAIVQCVFMLVRAAALMVLMVFVAPTAAGAASEEGWSRFKRLGLIILGFALYKPVAALIYAAGIMLMTQNTEASDGNDLKNALYGLTIMVMAAVALPAFIKFLVPLAATGSSSAFSGAAAAGVVAAGAAVVGTGGWGAAGAGGASSAATGGTTAAAGGAAGPAAGGGGASAVPPASQPGATGSAGASSGAGAAGSAGPGGTSGTSGASSGSGAAGSAGPGGTSGTSAASAAPAAAGGTGAAGSPGTAGGAGSPGTAGGAGRAASGAAAAAAAAAAAGAAAGHVNRPPEEAA